MKNLKKLKDEAFAMNVNGLSQIVDVQAVIADMIGGAPTLTIATPLMGAKANTIVELPVLSISSTWSSSNCNTTQADSNLDKRTVDVTRINDRNEICLDSLDGYIAGIQAGARNEELSFSELWVSKKIVEINKELEKLAWQGDTVNGVGNMALTDGYIAIAKGEVASLNYHSTGVAYSASTAINVIQDEIIANMNESQAGADDLTLFVNATNFSILSQAVLTAYNFQLSASEGADGEFTFPGTNLKVKRSFGMTSTELFVVPASQLRYATDLEGDREEVDMYFDKYHKQLVSDVTFAIGFNYELPSNVTLIEIV